MFLQESPTSPTKATWCIPTLFTIGWLKQEHPKWFWTTWWNPSKLVDKISPTCSTDQMGEDRKRPWKSWKPPLRIVILLGRCNVGPRCMCCEHCSRVVYGSIYFGKCRFPTLNTAVPKRDDEKILFWTMPGGRTYGLYMFWIEDYASNIIKRIYGHGCPFFGGG